MILYLPLAPVELTEASFRNRNGGWIGITAPMCSIGRNLVGLGRGKPADLAVDEGLDIADRAQIAQLVVVDRHLQDILHQDHDLHHRQRIDAQVLDQAQVIVRVLQLCAEVGLDEALDHADNNGRKMLGVTGLPELGSRLITGGGTAFKRFPQIRVIFWREWFWLNGGRIVKCLCHLIQVS